MNVSKQAILFAAGLLLTMSFIGILLMVYSVSTDTTKSALNDYSTVQTELAETVFLTYDNVNINGSQVLNALRKFQGKEQFGIRVITGKEDDTWYYNNVDQYGNITSVGEKDLSRATNESFNAYINPSGTFSSTLIRDKNNVIRGIEFRQVKKD